MTAPQISLTRTDWTLAGLGALAEGGVDAVKIDRLAKSLQVSRGSFYWHFKDRHDLLADLLTLWETDLTDQLIANAWDIPNAADRLRNVALQAMDRLVHGADAAKAENALRAWAAVDDSARVTMRRVDASRIAYIAAELERLGRPADVADVAARGLYMTLLGLFVARTYNPELADDRAWMAIVNVVLDSDGAE